MTSTAVSDASVGSVRPRASGAVRGSLFNTWTMTRRNLIHISREPTQLGDVTVQPVVLTVLFVYVFGGAVPIRGGDYVDFAVPGILTLCLVTSTIGTAVGMSTDLHEGIMERFRALPIWRPAVLVGRSLADLLTSVLCALIAAVTGLVVGWRPGEDAISVVGGFALVLFFAYAMSWVAAGVGLNSTSPESASAFGLVVLVPLVFVSNAMVPTMNMPAWVQTIADWNPISSVVAATRVLWGNPNPSGQSQAWTMQHPVAAALIWSAVILAVAAPVASGILKRKTTE